MVRKVCERALSALGLTCREGVSKEGEKGERWEKKACEERVKEGRGIVDEM